MKDGPGDSVERIADSAERREDSIKRKANSADRKEGADSAEGKRGLEAATTVDSMERTNEPREL